MEVDVLTICDNAQTYQDKLVVVGTFNNITTTSVPFSHPTFSLACRFRYELGESGEQEIVLTFKDPDGVDVVPTLNTTVVVPEDMEDSHFVSLAIGFNNIKFNKCGKYLFNVKIGDVNRIIPLYVVEKK